MPSDSVIAQALPQNTDQCPRELRKVLNQWKSGKATDTELVEASYYAQLDLLEEYRYRALPTPPEELAEYRQLSAYERFRMEKEKKTKLFEQCWSFLEQENRICTQNISNRKILEELLEWAKERTLPKGISDEITRTLKSHLQKHSVLQEAIMISLMLCVLNFGK